MYAVCVWMLWIASGNGLSWFMKIKLFKFGWEQASEWAFINKITGSFCGEMKNYLGTVEKLTCKSDANSLNIKYLTITTTAIQHKKGFSEE